jgi:hypothetical protein
MVAEKLESLKDYIHVNLFFGSAISLVVEAMVVTLKLIVMSRVRTTFSVRGVLLGLGLLCLGVFNDLSFAQSNPHPTARLTPVNSTDATSVVLQPSNSDDGSVAAENGVTTRLGPGRDRAGVFSAASARWQGLLRSLSVSVCSGQILTPKVSRYISKSVLIL